MPERASDDQLVRAERRIRVIVVEDEPAIAFELAEAIENSGGELIGTAATADDAMLLAAAKAPDVIVVDLHLKGRTDGVHAASAIRKQSSAAFVFITGSADAAALKRIRAFNGSAPLFKPLRYAELPRTILQALAAAEAAGGTTGGGSAP